VQPVVNSDQVSAEEPHSHEAVTSIERHELSPGSFGDSLEDSHEEVRENEHDYFSHHDVNVHAHAQASNVHVEQVSGPAMK
jgi:hypothetical protein